jgi:hypothetical protein
MLCLSYIASRLNLLAHSLTLLFGLSVTQTVIRSALKQHSVMKPSRMTASYSPLYLALLHFGSADSTKTPYYFCIPSRGSIYGHQFGISAEDDRLKIHFVVLLVMLFYSLILWKRNVRMSK